MSRIIETSDVARHGRSDAEPDGLLEKSADISERLWSLGRRGWLTDLFDDPPLG